MDWINTVLAFILGLLLRIGIPAAITALVVYFLRRLDARWQAEVMSAPTAALAVRSCWEVKGCPEKQRKACPAAAQTKVPCWQFFRAKDGVLRESCLGCDVFRQAPMPA